MPKPFKAVALAGAVIAAGVLTTSALPAGAASAAEPAGSGGRTQQRPAAADAQRRPRPDRPERLRLDCRPATNGEQRGIACVWSGSTSRRFAAYRLIRGNGETREVVFRTDDRAHTRFLDTSVERGTRYRYAVVALDAEGHVVGKSNVAPVGIPPAP